MKRYRVLSIDGGGIRGLVTAILIQRIQADAELAHFLDDVELISGTSTGGLLALGIAHGLDMDAIRKIYEEDGPVIFHDSLLDDIVDLGKLRGADYNIDGLHKTLERMFGNATLGDLKKKVLVAAFDLDNEKTESDRTWKPKLFHNFSGEGNDTHMRVVDVGLYTSAAPTYFPSVDGFIDGGVYASNPSMCGLAQTQDSRYGPNPDISDVVLLSLGTGISLQYVTGANHDWGYAQWVKPLISIMLDGTAGIADYQCRQILGARYHRLAPVFPAGVNVPMDGVEKIPYMIEFAEQLDIGPTIEWMKSVWRAD